MTDYFLTVLRGFLHNARQTCADYTVCDLPGGKKLEGCCTPSGKTFTSVARMLPAMADFVATGQPVRVGLVDLAEVILSIYRTAFDPKHPDYWGEPTGNKPTQRTVESSLVAMGDRTSSRRGVNESRHDPLSPQNRQARIVRALPMSRCSERNAQSVRQ